MKPLTNFGSFPKYPSNVIVRSVHKDARNNFSMANRRHNIYEQALEKCRQASETMKQLKEMTATKISINPLLKKYNTEQPEWIWKFMVGNERIFLKSNFGDASGPINDKCKKNNICGRSDEDNQYYYDKKKEPVSKDPCHCPQVCQTGGKKNEPCKKKEEPKKKPEPCKKKEDPPKKKEDPCKKKEDPCKKKEDPCKKKEDPCKKKEDPCKKKEDPCKKKEDPCKKKEDPCKKKEDPCKKKEDPCKKKEDPCKKKEDPCKKKEDPCKKKEDPCKKKEDPCKKKCSAFVSHPDKSSDIYDRIPILDKEQLCQAKEQVGNDYKNPQYFAYTKTAFYDVHSMLTPERLEQPSSKNTKK